MIYQDPVVEMELGFFYRAGPIAADSPTSSIGIDVLLVLQEGFADLGKWSVGREIGPVHLQSAARHAFLSRNKEDQEMMRRRTRIGGVKEGSTVPEQVGEETAGTATMRSRNWRFSFLVMYKGVI